MKLTLVSPNNPFGGFAWSVLPWQSLQFSGPPLAVWHPKQLEPAVPPV